MFVHSFHRKEKWINNDAKWQKSYLFFISYNRWKVHWMATSPIYTLIRSLITLHVYYMYIIIIIINLPEIMRAMMFMSLAEQSAVIYDAVLLDWISRFANEIYICLLCVCVLDWVQRENEHEQKSMFQIRWVWSSPVCLRLND